MDLADIQKLDAGSWFAPRFQGERIPTLAEVLDCLGNRIWINIEVKESAFEAADVADGIETQVVALVQSRKCGSMVLVSSFHPKILQRIARLDKTLALGLLTENQADDAVAHLAGTLRPYSWNPDAANVSPAMVDRMHKRNIRVFPYTVNSVSQAENLLEMKVDGLFTDDPAMMVGYCSGLEPL
jgi:glycerophosphoryl diester phosphodiesterase